MTTPSTTRDIQRATFIESLSTSLRKQAHEALADQQKFLALATSYMGDGLEEGECVELLMIDGLSRESAESYTSRVLSEEEEKEAVNELDEYSFQFEDEYGKIWSSYDIDETIRATNEHEAIEKADELLDKSSLIECSKVLSVSRIS
jgi:hypothetical protein